MTETMPRKGKGVLLPLLEVILCLAAAWWLLVACALFHGGGRVQEMQPWLVSEADPGAEGAMTTLEEEQFKWRLCGGLCVLCALPHLGAEIALCRYRRKAEVKKETE